MFIRMQGRVLDAITFPVMCLPTEGGDGHETDQAQKNQIRK